MLIAQSSEKTKARPADIWKVYENVSAWPTWNDAITFARLDGQFIEGAKEELSQKMGEKLVLLLRN